MHDNIYNKYANANIPKANGNNFKSFIKIGFNEIQQAFRNNFKQIFGKKCHYCPKASGKRDCLTWVMERDLIIGLFLHHPMVQNKLRPIFDNANLVDAENQNRKTLYGEVAKTLKIEPGQMERIGVLSA